LPDLNKNLTIGEVSPAPPRDPHRQQAEVTTCQYGVRKTPRCDGRRPLGLRDRRDVTGERSGRETRRPAPTPPTQRFSRENPENQSTPRSYITIENRGTAAPGPSIPGKPTGSGARRGRRGPFM
jgi:hypothetical protein